MADEPTPAPDEPLESFYGEDADEARRLAEPADGTEPRPANEGGSTRWRTPVTGALMAGIAMGLRDVFEPTYHDRTAVEQPAPEQPLEPQKYEVHLDPVAPESSFAIYRPWLEDEERAAGAGADDPEGPPADPGASPAPPLASGPSASGPPAGGSRGGGTGALGG